MTRRRSERSISIGAKVLLSHMALCVVIILLASLLSYVITAQYMKQARMEDLLEKAERIAESSRQMPEGEYVPSWRIVRTYAYLTDAKVFFLDANTEKIRMSWYRTGPETDDMPESDGEGVSKHPLRKLDMPEPGEGTGDGADSLQWVDVEDAIDREFVSRVLAGEKVSAMRHFAFARRRSYSPARRSRTKTARCTAA